MEKGPIGLNFINIINNNNIITDNEFLSMDNDLTFAILMMKILDPHIKFITVSEYREKYKNRLHPQGTNLLSNRGWDPISSHCGKYDIRDNWSGYITFEGIDDNENELDHFMGPSPEKLRYWFQTFFNYHILSYVSEFPFHNEVFYDNSEFYLNKLQLISKKLSSRDSVTTLLNSIKDVLINDIYN